MPGDTNQYNTRDVILRKGPEAFRASGYPEAAPTNSTTNNDNDNDNDNNSSNNNNNNNNENNSSSAKKGHYGHREAETSHLRSNGVIAGRDSDTRRDSEDTGGGVSSYSNKDSNKNATPAPPPASYGNDNDRYNRDVSRTGTSNGGAGVLALRDADAARTDREREREEARDQFREMPTRAVAVYERSYGKPIRPEKAPSVRKRHYDHMHMEDALEDKVATQLRENGVAETRVPVLSAKIAQAVRDDVIDASQGTSPQVSQQLRDAIHNHLDPLVYNKSHVTDLGQTIKSSDAPRLANMVLIRLGQVHEEAEACHQSVGAQPKTTRRGYTPREEADRSMLLQIKDGLEHQKTENDILQDKLKRALREHGDVEDDKERQQREAEELSAENWQLARDLKEADGDRESLIAKVREQQTDYDRLDRAYMELKADNYRMQKQLADGDTNNKSMSAELARLHNEKARLQVLLAQKEKEILHLRDPDKEMMHNLRILKDEVTLLRTQTRRLNEEKGLLRSRSQRMEASLDESHKARNKLSIERDNLVKENQELRTRYRRVALATPQLRALPDIMAGKNGPASSRATSRANSRAQRSSQEEKERRMSPANESEETLSILN